MNNWIEISEPRLAANFRAIGEVAGPGTTVLAVVKANAYGNGVRTVAPMLARARAEWLGVTSVTEAAEVRAALKPTGADLNILIMSGILPAAVSEIVQHRLTPVVWTAEQLRWLAEAPAEIPIHVEVDTGMSRQGVKLGADLEALLQALKQSANLRLDGLFTHFASSEIAGSPLSETQRTLFEEAIRAVLASGLTPTWLHAANTSAVDNPLHPPDWLAAIARKIGTRILVRTGLALYGHTLPIEGDAAPHLRPHLEPVLTWKTSVLDVREIAVGDTIGYNATFAASLPMRVALLSVGYADGLRRELSSDNRKTGGWVMIHNRRAPILGRISMNLTSVDVTNIPGVRAGDEAIVLGEGISAEDHARLACTIPYEILCGIHPCP